MAYPPSIPATPSSRLTVTALVTLNNITTDLATLPANHRIVVDHG
jgi:hypothetical protein